VRLRLSGGLAATNRLFAVTLDFGAVSRTGANATLFTAIGTAYGAGDGFAAGGTAFHASLASTAGCNNTTCSTAFTGGGGAHNNIQPLIVANYIINQ
jgi:microcystin-dependent protein